MTIISAVVLLGILIFVHELGHFLFAKLMGVKVEKFSLGFGPKLVGKRIGETEYLISALPLGGYVKMLGESAFEDAEPLSEEDRRRAYNYQPVRKRFPIILAGPLFNIAFAAFVFVLIFSNGVPVPYPVVGEVPEATPAHAAGLERGDTVLEIDGSSVESFNDIDEIVDRNAGKTLTFRVKRDGRILELPVTPERKTWKDLLGREQTGGSIGVESLLLPIIGEVMKGAPAHGAGLKEGDRIVRVDGTDVRSWTALARIIHKSPEKPLRFSIDRDGEAVELTITPEKKTVPMAAGEEEEVGLIGISPRYDFFVKKYGLVESISLGVKQTVELSGLTVISLVKLLQREIPADTLGGPILIAQMAGKRASQGALSFFSFMAFISISLGIINLFPIPVLDGGHLVFLGIEAVRRKPLSEKTILTAQKAGLVLILMLMAFAIYNDVVRWLTGKWLP